MKICMIIAPKDFRDEEYFIPKKIFKENNFEVITASKNTKSAIGSLGGKQKIDLDYSNIEVQDYDAIVFSGGAGSDLYIEDKIAHEIVIKAYKQNKIIAAICLAPAILAKSGILENKKSTCWPGAKHYLVNGKANYTSEIVEVDNNIITGNGPKAAEEFGKQIVKKLKNK